jgi:hypothetical protein
MHAFFYWLIQLTWGLPINIVGGIVAFVLTCMGNKPQKFGYAVYFEIGEHWGGVNFGGFFFVEKNASTHLKCHEYGHGFQNLILGVFMPLLVTIPSVIRYHYRNYRRAKGQSLPPYDQFWCEGWATKIGVKYYKE